MDEEREDVRAQDPRAVAALFCEDEESERVAIPGHPESWVELLPMDAGAMDRYIMHLTPVRPAGAPRKGAKAEAPAPVDLSPASEHLLRETVVNWHFEGAKGRVEEPPETRHGDQERARKDALLKLLRSGRGGISASLKSWLVGECQRVNHLDEEDTDEREGN